MIIFPSEVPKNNIFKGKIGKLPNANRESSSLNLMVKISRSGSEKTLFNEISKKESLAFRLLYLFREDSVKNPRDPKKFLLLRGLSFALCFHPFCIICILIKEKLIQIFKN